MMNYDDKLIEIKSENDFLLNEPNYFSENEITQKVIGACIKVHKALGPGLLESAYEICLVHELKKQGLSIESQVYLPVEYDGISLDAGYKIDILVEGTIILELKSVRELNDIHVAQIITYLKLSNKRIGLLINFNELKVVEGIRRFVNKY